MQTMPSPTHKWSFLPQTRLGQYAVGLLGLFIVAFGLLLSLVASGQTGGDRFFDNLWLAVPGLVAGVSVVSAGVTAVVAVALRGERSVLAYVTILIGMLGTFFIAGEFLSPH